MRAIILRPNRDFLPPIILQRSVGPGAPAPVNLGVPIVMGQARVGSLLIGTDGTWQVPPEVFAYQWLRGGVAIPGATAKNYVLVTADLGATIAFRVTAYNTTSETNATSANLGPVAPVFDPATLFVAGEAGAIYDPSDLTTLFQDTDGQTPVTAAGQSVAMMLPLNEVLGPEKIANGTFNDATGWNLVGAYWTITGGKLVGTNTSGAGYASFTDAGIVAGQAYVIPIVVVVTSGSLELHVGTLGISHTFTASGTYKLLITAGSGRTDIFFSSNDFTGTIDNVSVRTPSPFRMVQAAAGSRPTYSLDANGKARLAGGTGKSMALLGTIALAPPFYAAMALSRSVLSGNTLFGVASGTNSISIINSAATSRLSVGSARAGAFSLPGTRIGGAPVDSPFVADIMLTAGTTSVFVDGGSRDVTDDPTVDEGAFRTMSNSWLSGDSYAGAIVTIAEADFYGGVIRQAATSSADRKALAGYLRGKTGTRLLDTQTYVPVIGIGQSNKLGVGDYLTSAAVPFGNAAEYIDSGYLRPLKDPVQGQPSGQVATTGSDYPAFAKRLFELTGKRVAISGSAFSGEGLVGGSLPGGTWLNGELLTNETAAKWATMKQDVALATQVPIVLYNVGENDVDSNLWATAADYEALIVAEHVKVRTKLGAPTAPLCIISLDNYGAGLPDATAKRARFALMRTAMVNAAANNAGIYLVETFQNYIDAGNTVEGIHLNQTALNLRGINVAEAIVAQDILTVIGA